MKRLFLILLLSINYCLVFSCEKYNNLYIGLGLNNRTNFIGLSNNCGTDITIGYEVPSGFFDIGIHGSHNFCDYTKDFNMKNWCLGMNISIDPFYSIDKNSVIQMKVTTEIGYNCKKTYYHSYGLRFELFGRKSQTRLFIQDRVEINGFLDMTNVVELGFVSYISIGRGIR